MSATGLHCTNGVLCQMRESTSQFQLCRHESTFMKKKEDLYEENARLRADPYAALQESVTAKDLLIATLKEQNAQLQQSLADALLQVQEALTRMDRARNLLTDGNPRLHCNWGMLDTSDIKAALPAAYVGLVDNF